MKIRISLSEASIDEAINQLNSYKESLNQKANELCRRLAEIGATRAKLYYSKMYYQYRGPVDISVTVEERGKNQYAIVANGETVLIAEFGAGVTLGGGHPLNGQFGMGPGTYPGQTHAMTGKGWYLPKSKGGGHTYGNAPTMAMYNTGADLKSQILRVAEEVFKT